MPSNFLLLLAVLAGYVFIHIFNGTKFRAQALDGNRLVFEASISGFLLFLPARMLVLLADSLDRHGVIRAFWYRLAGQTAYLSTLVLIFLFAPVIAYSLNLGWGLRARWRLPRGQRGRLGYRSLTEASKARALHRAIQHSGNSLQQLLHRAALLASVDFTTICLTMADRKVYVGWVTRSPNLRANDSFVGLLPVMSGHRDSDTLLLRFDVSYPADRFIGSADDEETVEEEAIIILPVAEIRSARLFDFHAYAESIGKDPHPRVDGDAVPT